MSREVWIVEAVRSPRGIGKQGKGALAHLHPQRVLAQVLGALHERVGFDLADLDDVVCGNARRWWGTTPTSSGAWRCSMPAGRSRCRASC
jgi:acetyl-CoA acetyltransferase